MEYAYPDVLVSTQWVNDHLNDSKVRIVEVDYNPTTSLSNWSYSWSGPI